MIERQQVKTVDWCLIRIHDQEAIIETQRDRIAERCFQGVGAREA